MGGELLVMSEVQSLGCLVIEHPAPLSRSMLLCHVQMFKYSVGLTKWSKERGHQDYGSSDWS